MHSNLPVKDILKLKQKKYLIILKVLIQFILNKLMLIIILVRGINKVLEKIRFMNNKVNNKKKEINFVLKEYTNHKVIIKKII